MRFEKGKGTFLGSSFLIAVAMVAPWPFLYEFRRKLVDE